jgi:sugar lactone lactonase YvrE
MELELFCECASAPHAPAVDGRGRLVFALPDLGTVCAVDEASALAPPYPARQCAETRGQPVGLAFDADGVLFAADLVHQAIVTVASGAGAGAGAGGGAGGAGGGGGGGGAAGTAVFASEHEDERLLGPAGIAFARDGMLVFTDAGPEGETSLARPNGSVFAVSADGQLLRFVQGRRS